MVMVLGYQMPGGRVTVRYLRTGRELEAANAGDYVYPSDVRFNPQTNLCLLRHRAWRAELPMRLGCLSTIYMASVSLNVDVLHTPRCPQNVPSLADRSVADNDGEKWRYPYRKNLRVQQSDTARF
ncbi:MAG TPA: hypothetical protein VNZ03_33860 [Terriglobales bacterium]|nr:hypothetical protein [Terriglobales bacterium]